ncbi:M28 family metallopeptidase [Chitinophagaceae bacterium MMS25-I14]
MKRTSLILLVLLSFRFAVAQDIRWLKHQVSTLSSTSMDGRGYVGKGREHAAGYIQRQFKEYGLKPLLADSSYFQTYTFPVNTFPGEVSVQLNKRVLVPGVEYLVDAASQGFEGSKLKVEKINLDKVKTDEDWQLQKKSMGNLNRIYLLRNTDSFCSRMHIRPRNLAGLLPKGCFIAPIHRKMMWDVATDTVAATLLEVQDSVLPRRLHKASVTVQNKLLRDVKNQNVIGMIPGNITDSFIFITAHYDHLGKMGHEATFPGASDNASGTAMMLYLTRYFAAHPQKYTLVFVAFSGEEAGLLGSKYFTEHPAVPLSQIRFLLNLDIMGDATDGITVVNATEYPEAFSRLQRLNTKNGYLPQVKSRGKAPNSDHYHFSEAGVPAFFWYSNGGKGYYHDVFDKANELSFNHIDGVIKLAIDFIGGFQ